MDGERWDFASDNTAGMADEALAALAEANRGQVASYGDDPSTRAAAAAFRRWFAHDCDVYFVFNGTAANALALAALCQPHQGVLVGERAHVETDECGAPEFFSNGSKLVAIPDEHGKLGSERIAAAATRRSDIHFPRLRALSLSQTTEMGTVYTPAELTAVCATARAHGLRVHLDGARFANALVALGCSPADLTWRAGVDVACIGGTKLGVGIGEAVVFFDRALSHDFAARCKQAGQLASKMRLLTAPWANALRQGWWERHARHANAMAARLAAGLRAAGIGLLHPVEANAVFCDLSEPRAVHLRARGWRFYRFIGGGARFMTSWATTPDAVEALLRDLRV